MRAAFLFLMLAAAGCLGPASEDATEPGPSKDEPPVNGWPGNHTETAPLVDSWQTFTINATPEGSLALVDTRLSPASALQPYYTLLTFLSDQNASKIRTFGVIALAVGDTADVSDVQVRGVAEVADRIDTNEASGVEAASIAMIEGRLLHDDTGPSSRSLSLLVFAQAVEPVQLPVAFAMVRPRDDARASFDAAAGKGELRHMEVVQTGGVFELNRLQIERAMGNGCTDPGVGQIRWQGTVSVSAATVGTCMVEQTIAMRAGLDGWTMSVVPVTLRPATRTIEISGVTDEPLESVISVEGAAYRQVFLRYPDRGALAIYHSATGAGATVTITDTAASWETYTGQVLHFATSAPIGTWLGVPIETCLNLGAIRAEAPPDTYCRTPPA